MSEIIVLHNNKIPTNLAVATSRYAVIDVTALTKLVNEHLTTCIYCGNGDIVFSIEENNGLSNTCKFFCKSCHAARRKVIRQKNSLKVVLDTEYLNRL